MLTAADASLTWTLQVSVMHFTSGGKSHGFHMTWGCSAYPVHCKQIRRWLHWRENSVQQWRATCCSLEHRASWNSWEHGQFRVWTASSEEKLHNLILINNMDINGCDAPLCGQTTSPNTPPCYIWDHAAVEPLVYLSVIMCLFNKRHPILILMQWWTVLPNKVKQLLPQAVWRGPALRCNRIIWALSISAFPFLLAVLHLVRTQTLAGSGVCSRGLCELNPDWPSHTPGLCEKWDHGEWDNNIMEGKSGDMRRTRGWVGVLHIAHAEHNCVLPCVKTINQVHLIFCH